METKTLVFLTICLAFALVESENLNMISALERYGYIDIQAGPSKCSELQDTPLPPYLPDTTKMAHITCDFCQKYNFSCKTRICQHTRMGIFLLPQKFWKDLAHALCELCRYHNLRACVAKFCASNANTFPRREFVRATCKVCAKNNYQCPSPSTNKNTHTLLEIVDRSLMMVDDYVMADNIFTSYPSEEPEIRKWDDLFNNLIIAQLERDYAPAKDYVYYYYGDDFYNLDTDGAFKDDIYDYMDD